MVIDIILQNLGENMDRKIKFIDFLFEGHTSDLVKEKNNKKKKVVWLKISDGLYENQTKLRKKLKKSAKKHKKKGKKTTSSGRQGRSTQDIVSNIWFP